MTLAMDGEVEVEAEPKPLSLAEWVGQLAAQSGFSILDQVGMPGREARHAAVPTRLHPSVYTVLKRDYPQGLFSHQAEAIGVSLDGRDVCLATPTASGKSLVFMTLTADLLLRDPAKTMCFLNTGVTEEVEVIGHRYTPQGLLYELRSPEPQVAWMVRASTVIPIYGMTKLVRTNLVTGETLPLSESDRND